MTDDAIAMRPDHYDAFAESYAQENESGLFNAHYALPAMVALAGEVRERQILDAGCGAGPLSAALRDRGARTAGFDSSPRMVELAQRRLGPDARVVVADLAKVLPFGTEEFDDVVASLVLHYLEDWSGPLAELRRVLRPGGRLILSVNHPVIRPVVYPDEDYFAITPYMEDHTFGAQTVTLTFWHRSLHAMSEATAVGPGSSVLHSGGIRHLGHQRAAVLTRHAARAAAARDRGPHVVPLLPLLRPRGPLRRPTPRELT